MVCDGGMGVILGHASVGVTWLRWLGGHGPQDLDSSRTRVTPLAEVPDEFLERIRARANQRITELETPGQS